MPITSPLGLHPISQAEFAELDYRVMRAAFDSQNELGRLCEEAIYQNDLAARIEAAGLSVETEVRVAVTHGSFAKVYLLDLVVANAGIYELKSALRLAGSHEAQLLNYLLLCGANHGKLINFRPAQVESRFVNTTLTQAERRRYTIEAEAWLERDQTDVSFREHLIGLLNDWGCWLDVELYVEAMIHFAGGAGQVLQRLPLSRGDVSLGRQSFSLLNPETAFRITALTQGIANYEHHLRSMLRLSPLRTLHWVNLGRQRVRLVSLSR